MSAIGDYAKAKQAAHKAGLNGDFKKLVSAHATTAAEPAKARTSVFADCEATRTTVLQYMEVVGGWQKAISSDKAWEAAIVGTRESLTAIAKRVETGRSKVKKA